jgi:erythronate-4-phosphate dehydrogenase
MENRNLKILIEANVPFVKGLLEPYADVIYLPANQINRDTVKDVDAMIIRTRTRCNADLLEGSRCRFIATATIGTDHIDLEWCKANGITAVNAPGCNAPAVAQYVFASLLQVLPAPLSDYTIGIVGVGHVGSIVEDWAHQLGMKVLVCDPPRQRAEGDDKWVSLSEIAQQADIITFHTPLTTEGEDKTWHIADAQFLNNLGCPKPILINCARGPIVDNQALVQALDAGKIHAAIIDCWENEPQIMPQLLERAAIATPHIAGYSREGKIRASQQAVDRLTNYFNLPALKVVETQPKYLPDTVTAAAIRASYNPLTDTNALKTAPTTFETLRNTYHLREEV